MYLHVLLVNDTVETSDLLSLLGVGLLKFAQTLVYLAQNNIYVSTVACHFFGAKISIYLHMAKSRFTSLNADF